MLSVLARLLCQGILSLGVAGLLLEDSLDGFEGCRATDAVAGPEPRLMDGDFLVRERDEAREAVLPVVLLLHLRSRGVKLSRSSMSGVGVVLREELREFVEPSLPLSVLGLLFLSLKEFVAAR